MEKVKNIINRAIQSPFIWALIAVLIRFTYRGNVLAPSEFVTIITISILYCILNKTSLNKKFIIRFSIYYPLLFFALNLRLAVLSIYDFYNRNVLAEGMPAVLNMLQIVFFQCIFLLIALNIIFWSIYLIINFKKIFNRILEKTPKLNINIKSNSFFSSIFSFLKNKTFITVTLTILSVFILLNLLIFGSIISKESKGTINKEARIYLASAYAMNKVYIFPLSKTFGFLSPVTKPFYMTRNFLYKKGMDKLAPADGEREWWWFRIREQEFINLYMKAMFDWNEKNVLPKNKADELIKMEDEVYSNLLNIPNAEPYDKSLTKEKYLMFIETAYRYAIYFSYLPLNYKKDYYVDYSNKEITHFEKLYAVYLKYKNYVQTNEKESLQYIQKNDKLMMREYEFSSQLLRQLLSARNKKKSIIL